MRYLKCPVTLICLNSVVICQRYGIGSKNSDEGDTKWNLHP
jgi:hypothetical protein